MTTIATNYDATLAAKVCEAIGNGSKSLRAACEDAGCAPRVVYGWLARKEPNGSDEFAKLYAAACRERDQYREDLADDYVAEALQIADDGTNDYVERQRSNGSTFVALDTEAVQRSKLRVDTRLRIAAKLAPKRYGDKVELDHKGQVGVAIRKFTEAPKEAQKP